MYSFFEMSINDLQGIDIVFFDNIEQYLTSDDVCNIINKYPILNYVPVFKQNDNIPVLHKLFNDYKNDMISIDGLVFAIDGEYQDIPLNIFQNIFNDLDTSLRKKILELRVKKIKRTIKIIGIFTLMNKRSREKIKKRLSTI